MMAFGGTAAPGMLLKSPREIEIMARGGAILRATLLKMRDAVRPGISTMELDAIGEAFIRTHAGAEPAFKGLYGFPGSVCISINEEVVHGIPSRKRILNEGDIVTVDVGVKLEGMYTDAAITVPVGVIDDVTKKLLDVTERALAAGIAAALPDNHVGDIGAAIQAVVEPEGFSSCASWWDMAWASRRTRSCRSRTTASRSAARSWCRDSPSRSNRW